MAGVSLGGVLGAVTGVTSLFDEPNSLKSFLKNVDSYGILVQNNFEVNFSGFTDANFFITDITLPSMELKYTDVYYNGRSVNIPINYDYSHDVSMTVINDASGYIYPAIMSFLMNDSINNLVNGGYTMIIKGLTGDDNYNGLVITLRGVRFNSIGGLTFGHSQNNISTFNVGIKCIDFTVTAGGVTGAISNIATAVNSILG